jgi:hypothetical protein
VIGIISKAFIALFEASLTFSWVKMLDI